MYSCKEKVLDRTLPGKGPRKLTKYSAYAFLLLVLLLFGTSTARSQGHDILGARGLIPRLKKTYKLTTADVASLTPLVSQENVAMLTLYLRFSKDPPEYSERVWIQIIELRQRSEKQSTTGLNGRRRSALVAASRMLERRMLTILVEDYVEFLAEYLELEDWQFDEVSNAFDWDRKQKLASVNRQTGDLPALHRELAAVSAQTEWSIRNVLTSEQFKELRQMLEKGTPVSA